MAEPQASQSQQAPVQEWRQAWSQMQQSPDYQEADDQKRREKRQSIFRDYIAPNISNLDMEKGFEIFNAQTAPAGDADSSLGNDVWELFESGTQGTLADLAQGAMLGHQNVVSDKLREWSQNSMDELSPSMLRDVNAFGFEDNADSALGFSLKEGSTWRGFAGSVVKGGGSLLPSMIPGGLLGKGLSVAGRAAAGTNAAVRAAAASKNAVRTATVAKRSNDANKAMALGTKIDKATGYIGQSTAMGGMIMGGTSNQAYQDAFAQPEAELMKSSTYRQYVKEAGDSLGNDDPELAKKEARRRFAEEAGLKNRWQSFGVGAVSGLTNVPQLNMFRGMGSASRMGGAAKSGFLEMGQEAWESGAQQYLVNKSIGEMGLERDPMKDVLSGAATGAVLGFALGGPLGAIATPQQALTPEQNAERLKNLQGSLATNEATGALIEADLAQSDINDEQRLEYENKLEANYRERYNIERDIQGLPPAPRQHDPVTADPNRNHVSDDIEDQIRDDQKEKSDAQQDLKREMKNGGDATTAQQHERNIGLKESKLAIKQTMADNRSYSKYFNTEEEFADWAMRHNRGGNSEVQAGVELAQRRFEYDQALAESEILSQALPSHGELRKEKQQIQRERLANRVSGAARQALGMRQRKQQFEQMKPDNPPTPDKPAQPPTEQGTGQLRHLSQRLEDTGTPENRRISTRLRGILGTMATHGNRTFTIEGQTLQVRSGRVDPKQLKALIRSLEKKAPRTRTQLKSAITSAAVRKMKAIAARYTGDNDSKTNKLKKTIERVIHVLEKKGVMRQKYGDKELYINRGEVSAKDLNSFIKWLQSEENTTPDSGYWRARLLKLADQTMPPGKQSTARNVLVAMSNGKTQTIRYGNGKTLTLNRGVPDHQEMTAFAAWLKPIRETSQKTQGTPKNRFGMKGNSGTEKQVAEQTIKPPKTEAQPEPEPVEQEAVSGVEEKPAEAKTEPKQEPVINSMKDVDGHIDKTGVLPKGDHYLTVVDPGTGKPVTGKLTGVQGKGNNRIYKVKLPDGSTQLIMAMDEPRLSSKGVFDRYKSIQAREAEIAKQAAAKAEKEKADKAAKEAEDIASEKRNKEYVRQYGEHHGIDVYDTKKINKLKANVESGLPTVDFGKDQIKVYPRERGDDFWKVFVTLGSGYEVSEIYQTFGDAKADMQRLYHEAIAGEVAGKQGIYAKPAQEVSTKPEKVSTLAEPVQETAESIQKETLQRNGISSFGEAKTLEDKAIAIAIAIGIELVSKIYRAVKNDPFSRLNILPEDKFYKILLGEIKKISKRFEEAVRTGETGIDGVSVDDLLGILIIKNHATRNVNQNAMDQINNYAQERIDGTTTLTFEELLDSVGYIDKIRNLSEGKPSGPPANKTEKSDSEGSTTTVEEPTQEGSTTTVAVPGSDIKLKVLYKVVENSDLITSHNINGAINQEYPEELQPRDRTRQGSEEQIIQLAGQFDPALATANPLSSDGAPIVNASGQVESGNGRTLALRNVYGSKPELAKQYKQYLIDHASEFGLDPKVIEGMEQPQLVRERQNELTDQQLQEYLQQSNNPNIAETSATEQAFSDAQQIDEDLIQLFNPGADGSLETAGNKRFLDKFYQKIKGSSNQLRTSNGKAYTRQFYERLQGALFAKAYQNKALVSLALEENTEGVANILKALNVAAPEFARVKARHGDLADLNMIEPLVDALRVYREAKANGQAVDEYISQGDMLSDNAVPHLTGLFAQFIDANERRHKQMGLEFTDLARKIGQELDLRAQGNTLLGEHQRQSLDDIISASNRNLKAQNEQIKNAGGQPGLFSEGNQPTTTAQGEESGGPATPERVGNQQGQETGGTAGTATEGNGLTEKDLKALSYDDLVRMTEAAAVARRKLPKQVTPAQEQYTNDFYDTGQKPTRKNIEQFLASKGVTGYVDPDVKAIRKALLLVEADRNGIAASKELNRRKTYKGQIKDHTKPPKALQQAIDAAKPGEPYSIKTQGKVFQDINRWLRTLNDESASGDSRTAYRYGDMIISNPRVGGVSTFTVEKPAVERNDQITTPTTSPVAAPEPVSTTEPVKQPTEAAPTVRQKRKRKRAGKIIEIDAELDALGAEMAAIFKEQSGRLSSGVDPVIAGKLLLVGVKASIKIIEKGAIKFADWADGMLDVLDRHGVSEDDAMPYLKRTYLASKAEVTDKQFDQMDSERDVRSFDMDSLFEEEAEAEPESNINIADRPSGVYGYTDEHSEWAIRLADKYNGAVIYSNDDFALIESTDEKTGEITYPAGIDRGVTGSSLTDKDVTELTGYIVPPEQKQELIIAREYWIQEGKESSQPEPTLEPESQEAAPKGAVFGYSEQHPEWATSWEKEITGGAVIYSDDTYALLEGYSTHSGRPVYSLIARSGNSDTESRRTTLGLSSYTGDLITGVDKDRLLAVEQQWRDSETAKHEANPDGPFAKGEQVAASDTISKGLVKAAENWLKMLGIDKRVFITTPFTDTVKATEQYHLYGPYSPIRHASDINSDEGGYTRRLSNGEHVIMLKPESDKKMLVTLAHEIGHIVQKEAFDGADIDTVKNPIIRAFNQWINEHKPNAKIPGSAREMIESMRHPVTADVEGITDQTQIAELTQYWSSFNEWFADNVARWATTQEKPLTVVDKFFKSVANQLRKLYQALTGRKYLPNDKMKEFLDQLGPADFTLSDVIQTNTEINEDNEKAETSAPQSKWTEHTTKKGNQLRGIIRDDLTKAEALKIDPYSFRKDGGWFIRAKYVDEEPPDTIPVSTPSEESATIPPETTTEATTNERTDNHQERPSGTEPTEVSGAGTVGTAGTHDVGVPGTDKRSGSAGSGTSQTGISRPAGRGNNSPVDATGSQLGEGNSAGPDHRGDTSPVRSEDYRITAGSLAEERSWPDKARDNIEAIKILKQLRKENRNARPDEQAVLVRYVGWGAGDLANNMFPVKGRQLTADWQALSDELKRLLTDKEWQAAASTVNSAFFTNPSIINTMYAAAKRLGIKSGLTLEGGTGIGHFAGLIPADMNLQYTGVEMDPTSALIAQALYPGKGIINGDFTKVGFPEDHFNLVIGNPPYVNSSVKSDPKYANKKFMLHDYFIAKQIDALKAGGIGVFVTSSKTMDKQGQEMRQYVDGKAHFLGAIRLPNTAFSKNAGTEVVTDIIFFQKRGENTKETEHSWLSLGDHPTLQSGNENEHGVELPEQTNRYFLDNPDMVLGTEAMVSGPFGMTYTVKPALTRKKGESKESWQNRLDTALTKAMNKALKELPKKIVKENPTPEAMAAEAAQYDFNPEEKEDSFYIREDGSIGQVIHGYGQSVVVRGGGSTTGLNKKQQQYVRSYIPLRQAVMDVYKAQNGTEAEWQAAVKAMEREYDAFVKKNGSINQGVVSIINYKKGAKAGTTSEQTREPVISILQMDPELFRVAAIEDYDISTNTAKKGRIFIERVLGVQPVPQITSAVDAVGATLNQFGYLDMEKVQALYDGLPMNEIISELGDQIYSDPATGKYVLKDNYLSGNVKAKLQQAKNKAATDPAYQRNVTALEAVIPEDLPVSAIPMGLGGMWIPTDTIKKFAENIVELSGVVASKFQRKDKSSWKLTGRAETSPYATQRRTAAEILEATLNKRSIIVKDTVVVDGKKTYITNDKETAAANQKQNELKEAFERWAREDGATADTLSKIYNRDFNTTVPTQHNGQHLTFPGLSSKYQLRPHQKDVAWRIIQNGNTYMAHAVGAGKTLASIVSAMELKRLGIVNKPTFVVLKSTLRQFAAEFLDAYPGARILVADEKQLDSKNRRRFIAKVASENWDAVIMTHQSFQSIPMSDAYVEQYINQQLAELDELLDELDADDMPTRKTIERQKKDLEEKLKKQAEASVLNKDKGLAYEESGIDFLFMDEAHTHKKIGFATKQGNLKGVDSSSSNIATDLFMKTQFMEGRNPGNHTVLMSGTPITNTMGELFNIQRYLQPSVLEANQVSSFDSWSATFAESTTNIEMQPDGSFKPTTRLTRFVGVPGLMRDVLQVMDYVGMSQMREQGLVKLPKVNREVMGTEKTPAMARYQQELGERIAAYEKLSAKEKREKGVDGILVIMGDGKKAAIDLRMVNRTQIGPSKLDNMIDTVFERWQNTRDTVYSDKDGQSDPVNGSIQLIFSDIAKAYDTQISKNAAGKEVITRTVTFDAFKYIKEQLISRGVPASEIAFINDYKDSMKKKRLFNEVNTGRKTIILGGSDNLGTGVNVQKRLIALHNLDINYVPAKMEQRTGRGERQGNQNSEIENFLYVTKGTTDATTLQMNENKTRMADQVLRGDFSVSSMEDVGTSAADDLAQAKAIASGNPLLMEQASVNTEYRRLVALRDAHINKLASYRSKLQADTNTLERYEKGLPTAQTMAEQYVDTRGDKFTATLNGQTITQRKAAGDALLAQLDGVLTSKSPKPEKIGTVAGYDLYVFYDRNSHEAVLSFIPGDSNYTVARYLAGDDLLSAGVISRVENRAAGIQAKTASIQQTMANLSASIERWKKGLKQPFDQEQALKEQKARLAEIESELESGGEASNDVVTLPQKLENHQQFLSEFIPEHGNTKANTGAEGEYGRYSPEGTQSPQLVYQLQDGRMVTLSDNTITEVAADQVEQTGPPQARYSLLPAGSKAQGIKPYEAKTLQKQLTRAIGDLATVVQNESDLPKHLYDQIKADGVQGRVKGVYDPQTDTVYIIAGNVESLSDGMRTALHEAVGHKGLRGVLGSALNRTLDQIYDSLPDSMIRALRKEYVNQIAGKSREEQRRIIAEEYLAHLAETDPQNSLVQRVVAKIRNWMRQYLPSLKWSDGDIRQLMIEASQKAKDARQVRNDQSVRYSVNSAYRNNKHMSVESVKKIASKRMQQFGIGKDTVLLAVANSKEEVYGKNNDVGEFFGTVTGHTGLEEPILLLIADQHTSAQEVAKTVDHELIAHLGLAKFFQPEEKQRLLDKVKKSKNTTLKPAWEWVESIYVKKSIDEQAEEVIAYIAENPDWNNKGWRKIVELIVSQLQKIGLFKGLSSRQEIESILGDIAQFYRSKRDGRQYFSLGYGETELAFGPGITTPEQRRQFKPATMARAPQKQDTPDSSRYKLSSLSTLDTAQATEAIGKTASSVMESVRNKSLGWLGGRQISDLYGKVFDAVKGKNPLQIVSDLTQKLSATRSLWANAADRVDNLWARLAANKYAYKQVNDLMYESTLAEVDPSKEYEPKYDVYDLKRQYDSAVLDGSAKEVLELDAKLKEEAQRKADYKRLETLYEPLPDNAKQVFTEVRDYYQSQWDETRKALHERVKGMGLDAAATAGVKAQIDALFHRSISQGPYFPLMRFGEFAAIGETPDGKPFRQHFESQKALKDGIKALEKKGHIIESSGKTVQMNPSQMGGVTTMTSKIMESLDSGKMGKGLSEDARMAFMDEINQMALAMLPELSAAKRSMHRGKVAGFDTNARRSFATVALHGANRLGRIKYGWQIEQQLDRMDEVTDASQFSPLDQDEKIIGRSVAEEMRKRHDLNMNPNGHPLASHITNAAFFMYLGGSIGAGLVNMTQNILVALPQLGSRFGYTKTSRAMAKASKDYFAFGGKKPEGMDGFLRDSWFDLTNAQPNQSITKEEIALIQALIDDGTIDTTQAHTLAQIADSDLRPEAQKTKDWYTKMTRASGLFFHNAEVSNRQIAALTAYRLYRDNARGTFDHESGIEFARKAVFDAHFDYSGYNRPRHFKGNWSKVLLIFKQHSQNMTYNLAKTFYDGFVDKDMRGTEDAAIARRTLLGTLGLHATFAGVLGLPGMSVMLYAAGLAMGDDDDPVDPRVEVRNVFADWFGVSAGHALSKGVFNEYLGIDLHARTSLNDLWVKAPGYDMPARQEAMYYVTNSIGGPAISQIINSWVGLDEMMTTGSMKGLQRMMPKFIRDGLKTVEYSEYGVTDRNGKVINDNMTPGQLAWQAVGISSARTSESYTARGAILDPKGKITKRQSILLGQLDRAVRTDNQPLYQQAMASIDRFNEVQKDNDRDWAVITPKRRRRSLASKKKARDTSKTGVVLPDSQLGMRENARSYAL